MITLLRVLFSLVLTGGIVWVRSVPGGGQEDYGNRKKTKRQSGMQTVRQLIFLFSSRPKV